jgi:hypothetical protein
MVIEVPVDEALTGWREAQERLDRAVPATADWHAAYAELIDARFRHAVAHRRAMLALLDTVELAHDDGAWD